MKKQYVQPMLDVVLLKSQDVVTVSGGVNNGFVSDSFKDGWNDPFKFNGGLDQ